ncbi:3-dehydroquinate synthase [Spirochaetia bacterium]|nr:3-dehydroquinate synthase [Spirochaetia bacterium]
MSRHHFQFGNYASSVVSGKKLPRFEDIFSELGYKLPEKSAAGKTAPGLVVCDKNTTALARDITNELPVLTLPPGEAAKTWQSVETILRAARNNGLGRDGLFIGIGGGVICDLTAFAASIYMRGAELALVPTTLLCMVDAAVGGKTGFDLEGLKNLAGTFYPAKAVFIASEALKTLPLREWKSGLAELFKTAVLSKDESFFEELRRFIETGGFENPGFTNSETTEQFLSLIEKAVLVKGRIVEVDPREDLNNAAGFGMDAAAGGTERALLNLGHTFGHALESALGLGTVTHGEAVAWGLARSAELGQQLGITPPKRAEEIIRLSGRLLDDSFGKVICRVNGELFHTALLSDKKKKAGKPRFVVPSSEGALIIEWNKNIETYCNSLAARFSGNSALFPG